MIYSKYIISAIKSLFCSLRIIYSKKKMFKELRKNPQSIPLLDKAYNNYLNSLKAKEKQKVEMKSVKVQFTRCPILLIRRPIGKHTLSSRAKEVLSETDIVKALERHKNGDWGFVDPEDWSKCNLCLRCGKGFAFSRHRTSDGRFFCVLTDYEKPKTKIIMEDEFYAVQSGHETACGKSMVTAEKKTA